MPGGRGLFCGVEAPDKSGRVFGTFERPCWQRGLREASGAPSEAHLKRTISRLLRFTRRFGVSHSQGDLTGYSPAACRAYRAAHSCLWDWSSVARRRALGSRAASPAGFGAFALLDGPGLTQFRVLGYI